MASPLTQEHFDQALEGLRQTMATKEELDKLFAMVATREDLQDVRQELQELRNRVDLLTSAVDAFATTYRQDADERAVLAGRVDRIKKTLIKKGVAREQELAV